MTLREQARELLALRAAAALEAPRSEYFSFRQGSVWKDAILMPDPDGPAGYASERVILRANPHFPHEALLRYIAAAAELAPLLAQQLTGDAQP